MKSFPIYNCAGRTQAPRPGGIEAGRGLTRRSEATMAQGDDAFDSREVQSDIERIRKRLKRLDQERRDAVDQLEQAMKRADETIARHDSGGLETPK
jgi:hypothetical protein